MRETIPHLLQALEGRTVLLAAATYLKDAGNVVQLRAPAPWRKSPDLAVVIGTTDVAVEVKTRDELIDPQRVLDAAAASEVIRRSLHRRASRQLRVGGSGLLAVGGLRVHAASLDALKHATPGELSRRGVARSHIAGALLLFTVGMTEADVPVKTEPTPAQRARMGVYEALAVHVNPRVFVGEVACRVALNPTYAGAFRPLRQGESGPGIRLPYGDTGSR